MNHRLDHAWSHVYHDYKMNRKMYYLCWNMNQWQQKAKAMLLQPVVQLVGTIGLAAVLKIQSYPSLARLRKYR